VLACEEGAGACEPRNRTTGLDVYLARMSEARENCLEGRSNVARKQRRSSAPRALPCDRRRL